MKVEGGKHAVRMKGGRVEGVKSIAKMRGREMTVVMNRTGQEGKEWEEIEGKADERLGRLPEDGTDERGLKMIVFIIVIFHNQHSSPDHQPPLLLQGLFTFPICDII